MRVDLLMSGILLSNPVGGVGTGNPSTARTRHYAIPCFNQEGEKCISFHSSSVNSLISENNGSSGGLIQVE